MNLVIVESPTKARTLSRFLGDGWNVEATYGHVRDLPEKKIGVGIERLSDGVIKFTPEYVQTAKQKERVEVIKRLSDEAGKVYLATDPDREGEAIAFHVAELLKANPKSQIPNHNNRIVFHEITEKAVKEALNNPRGVDMQLVNAQQARRVTDRLVGYKLSPLLWVKVRRGLSAGRVQSVALRLVVEREREIESFKPTEYWVIKVQLSKPNSNFWVNLIEENGKKAEVGNAQKAGEVEEDLKGAKYWVAGMEKKEFKRTPPPPYTTSTMQQAGANKFGWSAKKTMQVAQSLYEQGYITYHRTDSTNLSVEAVKEAAGYISEHYGREYALGSPRVYVTKSKVAQEAHEAIRPTLINISVLSSEQANKDEVRLYELIWTRFTACQMAEARGETVTITVTGQNRNEYKLQAKGETINFDGWTRLYLKMKTNGDIPEATNEKLPELSEGEKLDLQEIAKEQKFTQPPSRYNEAGLIKALEELGIGRPSTYAPTLTTIQDRQYVEKIEKKLKPTSLGVAVNDFLTTNFPKIVDYQFTAKLEDELDEIANGTYKWQKIVGDFYDPFEKDVDRVKETAKRVKVEVEMTGDKCPECSQGEVVVRIGRYGRFLACSRYPDCKYKANYVNKIGVKCPKCGGDVITRKTKSRKTFYGCSNYPKCDFASWSRPSSPDKLGTTDGAVKPEVKEEKNG